jgi:hypothetical protein
VQPYPAQDNQMNSYYHQQQVPQQQTEPLSRPAPAQTQPTGQGQHQGQQQPQVQHQHQPQLHTQFEPQLHHAQSQLSIQTQPQTQQGVVPQQQQQQPQPQSQTQTPETQVHPQAQTQQQTTMTGPPFVFDPAATYPDENVQAWAQYYAQGGTDPTGSVYFISVPGITDARTPTSPTDEQQQQQAPEPHQHHLRRESSLSLPNPYASSGGMDSEDVSPASAGAAPGAGGNAPWQTTLPAQFTQMRVGEPSVGA